MNELIKLFESRDFEEISTLKRVIDYIYNTKELAINEEYLKKICAKIAKELNCEVKYKIKATYHEGKDVTSYIIIDKKECEINYKELPYVESNKYFTTVYEFNNSYLKEYLKSDKDNYIITKPEN